MSEQEQAADSAEIRARLGSQLKAAREYKTLSIEQVASQLMLDQRVIEGLEAGDYAGLPEPTFVRGYLYAYLRLMGKPESLLAEFDEINRREYPVVLTEASAIRSSCSDDGWVRCVSVGLVVVLLVAIGLWFAEQSFQVLDAMQAEPQIVSTQDDAQFTETDAEFSIPTTVVGVKTDAEIGVAIPQSAGEDKAKPPLAITDSVATVESATTSTESTPPVAQNKPGKKSDNELVLRFTGSSWIRVVDAQDSKLAAGTYEDEQELVLRGKLPYSVILGDSGVVKMWFGGKAIQQSFKPGKVARFTLGKNGLQHQ